MRNFLFFCILACTLASCSEDFFEQTIEIDPPAYQKQMVAHALAGNLDSVLVVPLTRNFSILDQTPDSGWTVRNAVVEIYEDGQLKTSLLPDPIGGPGYAGLIPPGFFQAGKTYELRASHPDFPTISAKQVMPGPFQLDSAVFRENAGISPDGDKLSAVDVYLKDKAGERNYYVIAVDGLYQNYIPIYDSLGNVIGIDTVVYNYYSLYAEAPEDPNALLAANNTLAVSDQFFDGQSYRFSFRTYRDAGNARQFSVHVWSVTEDYFLYIASAQRKADSEDIPLIEPVTVFHNVENGIGIFGLGWEEVRKVE